MPSNLSRTISKFCRKYRARSCSTGQVMILAAMSLSGVILAATTIAGVLMTYQIRHAANLESSAKAVFAADAGVECALYDIFKSNGCGEPSLELSNGASYTYTMGSGSLPDPVAWWTFDEGVGSTAADSSGNGNNGAWGGTGSRWGTGKIGPYAGDFNGVDNYVSVPDSPSLNLNTFAVAFWIYPRSVAPAAQYVKIIGKESLGTTRNFGVYIVPDSLYVRASYHDVLGNNNAIDSSLALTLDAWNHVVADYDGYDLRLYINGRPDNWIASPNPPVNSAAPVLIGGLSHYAYFDGLLDDIRAYDVALSSQDVGNLYFGTEPPKKILSEGNAGSAARAFLLSL